MVHLHSLNPPLVHMNFKTRNVLVDGDLTPKVGDAGIHSLLDRIDGAASSLRITEDDPFLDPEYSSNFRISLETIFMAQIENIQVSNISNDVFLFS